MPLEDVIHPFLTLRIRGAIAGQGLFAFAAPGHHFFKFAAQQVDAGGFEQGIKGFFGLGAGLAHGHAGQRAHVGKLTALAVGRSAGGVEAVLDDRDFAQHQQVHIDHFARVFNTGLGLARAPQRHAARLHRFEAETGIGEQRRITRQIVLLKCLPVMFGAFIAVVVTGGEVVGFGPFFTAIDVVEQQTPAAEFFKGQGLFGQQFGRGHAGVGGHQKTHLLGKAHHRSGGHQRVVGPCGHQRAIKTALVDGLGQSAVAVEIHRVDTVFHPGVMTVGHAEVPQCFNCHQSCS